MEGRDYLVLLEGRKSFNRSELLQVMHCCGEPVGDALFKVRLQNLLKSGRIVRVGRNAYCVPPENLYPYEHTYSEHAGEVADRIRASYPYLDFTVFETTQLNEFVNHQLAHNAVFVSVEKDLGEFVFETLKEVYPGKVLLNPTPQMYHQYWYEGMIVVERLISEAPKDGNNAWASRLEKILVDIQTDKLLLNSVSRSEYPGIFEQAFQKYVIDESALFRYAKRRGAEKRILEFISRETNIQLRTRGKQC